MNEQRGNNAMKKGVTTLLAALTGGIVGAGTATNLWKRKCNVADDWGRKMLEFYNTLNQWLKLRQEGRSLVEYFEKNEYKTVAIYGMKELGERLYDELSGSNIEVLYAIDKRADRIYANVDIVTPEEELLEVDVIVVTAIHYFDDIEEVLASKVDYPIISIEDVVYGM